MTDPSITQSDHVTLVQCVSSKRTRYEAVPARDLYDSRLWRAQRQYAEAQTGPWFIMSAEHGLIEPDAEITTYDTSLRDYTADQRRVWAVGVVDTLREHVALNKDTTVTITAGKIYSEYVSEHLWQTTEVAIHEPLEGLRMNARCEELDQRVEAGT